MLKQPSTPPEIDVDPLAKRLGKDLLTKRRHLQAQHNEGFLGQCRGIWKIENYIDTNRWIERAFKISGLYSRGRRNFLDIQIVENQVSLPHLPAAFEGFRILHMADLHSDLDPDFPDIVIDKLRTIDYDICVNTGDFRNKTRHCFHRSMSATRRIAHSIQRPHFGVLGNHDYIEKVADLEAMGIQMLLNESSAIEKNGHLLWICGVDDPVFYQTHDLHKARQKTGRDDISILLAHAPDVYREAAEHNYDFMLSGHTHGGQVCLPGGIPVFTHCNCPRSMAAGAWQYKQLKGYTSRGTGAGSTAVRFNCPPELTVHTLTRGSFDRPPN